MITQNILKLLSLDELEALEEEKYKKIQEVYKITETLRRREHGCDSYYPCSYCEDFYEELYKNSGIEEIHKKIMEKKKKNKKY